MEEEAWLLQDQTNEKVSCSEIYPTTFNDGPSSTEYQQCATAQVVGCQHCGGLGSIPSQAMCDLWWTKWQWDRPVSEYFAPPLPTSLYQCYTLIHSYIHPSIYDCHNLILAKTQIYTLKFITTLYTKRYAAEAQNTYFNKLPYQTAWFTKSVCCTYDTHYILAFLQGTDSHLLYMTLWSATHNTHLIRAEITSQPRALCPPPTPQYENT